MKNIFFILTALFLTAAKAYSYEGFLCNPSDRQTRFQALDKDNKIVIRVTNPSGYEFMPQFDGPVSRFSMGYQKFQYDSLQTLGDVFEISWPKKSCEINSDKFYVKCDGSGDMTVKGPESRGIETVNVTEEYYFGKYESRKFKLTFEQESNYFFVNLQFNTDNCKRF